MCGRRGVYTKYGIQRFGRKYYNSEKRKESAIVIQPSHLNFVTHTHQICNSFRTSLQKRPWPLNLTLPHEYYFHSSHHPSFFNSSLSPPLSPSLSPSSHSPTLLSRNEREEGERGGREGGGRGREEGGGDKFVFIATDNQTFIGALATSSFVLLFVEKKFF